MGYLSILPLLTGSFSNFTLKIPFHHPIILTYTSTLLYEVRFQKYTASNKQKNDVFSYIHLFIVNKEIILW